MTEKDVIDARRSWEDAVAHSLKVVSDGSLASDRAILELVQAVIQRVLALEEQVSMLMELHRLDELTK